MRLMMALAALAVAVLVAGAAGEELVHELTADPALSALDAQATCWTALLGSSNTTGLVTLSWRT